jgi:hypothetical protein
MLLRKIGRAEVSERPDILGPCVSNFVHGGWRSSRYGAH